MTNEDWNELYFDDSIENNEETDPFRCYCEYPDCVCWCDTNEEFSQCDSCKAGQHGELI